MSKTTILPPQTVEEFVNGPLREYSLYTISERALPLFVDGFKSTARKLFWLMQSQNGYVKVSALSGRATDKANYHHGDASGSVISMTRDFAGTNNIPYFIGKGEFGSTQNRSAAAPRYIECKPNPIMDKIYLDKDLHKPSEDLEDPEPLTFYPIIPMLLVNSQSGIATGFSCKFQSYHPLDVLNVIRHFVNTPDDIESTPELIPFMNGFKGTVSWDDEKNRWDQIGKWEQVNTTTLRITEIPVTFSRIQYLEYLIKLKNGRHISRYIEEKIEGDDNWNIVIKLSRTSKVWNDPIRMLSLRRSISMNMNCITSENRVKRYDYPEELAMHFTLLRLAVYTERIKFQLNRINNDIAWNMIKVDFVKVMSNLNFKEMSSNEIITHCMENGFTNKEYLAKLMTISISRLNKTGIDAFSKVIDDLKNEKEYYENTTEVELYNKDLDALEKEISKLYPRYNEHRENMGRI